MMISSNVPTTEMQERFQWLKQNDEKYICPNYAASANYTHLSPDWEDRLKSVMKFRKETLLFFYDWTDSLDLHSDVMSTAAFIFDKYLSSFVPQYVGGVISIGRGDNHLVGLSCLFIAAKSLLSWDEIDHIVNRFGKQSREVFLMDMETRILTALKWEVVYTPPMSVIQDLLTLLPRYHNYGYAGALDAFKDSILDEAFHLIKLTVVNYGFNIRYPPQSIALAVFMLSFELCAFQKFGLGLSFGDKEVVKCRNDIIYIFKQGSSHKKRSDTTSPTAVVEMHTSRGTIKKRNSFVAKTA